MLCDALAGLAALMGTARRGVFVALVAGGVELLEGAWRQRLRRRRRLFRTLRQKGPSR